MTFAESIKTCLFHKFCDFSGRASRSEFWNFWTYNFLIYFCYFLYLIYIFYVAATSWTPPTGTNLITTIFYILTIINIIPLCAVSARRLHDVNLTGWLQFLPDILIYFGFQTFYEAILAAFLSRNTSAFMWPILLFTCAICLLYYFYWRKGTNGPNKYGDMAYEFDLVTYKNNLIIDKIKKIFNKTQSIVTEKTKSTLQNKCPVCNANVEYDAKFCNSCGANLQKIICPQCNTENDNNAKFCNKCGCKLDQN